MNIQAKINLQSQQSISKVNIYVRNYKKVAILMPIVTPIKSRDLSKIISVGCKIAIEHLVLLLNGQKIDPQALTIIELKQKSIIHVVNLERVQAEKINISFKFKDKNTSLIVKTAPKMQIKEIFLNNIQPFFGKSEKQIFLAYLGKPINIFKTFEEQLIEDECEIMILQFKKEQIKLFEITQQYSKNNISCPSTVMLGMPVMGARDRSGLKMHKQKLNSMNKKKLLGSSIIQEFGYSPEVVQEEKKEENFENAAPDQQTAPPQLFHGFNPHFNAPNSKQQVKEQKPAKTPFKLKKAQLQASEKLSIKEKDLLYIGNTIMQQAQQFGAGVVSEYKQAFLKKKNSLGKQNSK